MTEWPDSSKSVGWAARRRTVLHAGGAAATALAMFGRPGAAHAADAAAPSHPRWKLVFVNHVTTNPFFVPTQYGIADACALYGCDYQWTGSATSDAAEMVNAMNAAVAARAAAIAVPIVDPKAFDRPVERALEAGIPVFAYNADAPPGSANARLAYIGGSIQIRPVNEATDSQPRRCRPGGTDDRHAWTIEPSAPP